MLEDDPSAGGESEMRVARVGADGTVEPRLTLPDRPPTAVGNGDGLTLFGDELLPYGSGPSAFAVAADGALIFAKGSRAEGGPRRGLRALVPPDSGRPRIALTQDGFAMFPSGRVRVLTGGPGAVAISARDGAIAVEARGDASQAGQHEVAFGALAPPGRYELRLRLTTPSGSAETIAALDTRTVLPFREARSALERGYEGSDGDDGGRSGTELDRCRRNAPRTIRCLLLEFDYGYAFDGPEVGRWSLEDRPFSWVTASLLNDGLHTAEEELPSAGALPSVCLRVGVDRHQRAAHRHGVRAYVRMRARCRGRVRVRTNLQWRVRSRVRHAVVTRARFLRAGRTWNLTVPLPGRAAAALRAGRRLRGTVVVRAALPTPYGPVREEQGGPDLRPRELRRDRDRRAHPSSPERSCAVRGFALTAR